VVIIRRAGAHREGLADGGKPRIPLGQESIRLRPQEPSALFELLSVTRPIPVAPAEEGGDVYQLLMQARDLVIQSPLSRPEPGGIGLDPPYII
jgi:hypothetical protein